MMIGYNLIRCLMQQAAISTNRPLGELSFKGILDHATASQDTLLSHRGKPTQLDRCRESIIEICATKTLTIRPLRLEPRAVKQRPKSYQYLTKPRHEFEETPHRGRATKAA